jgi:hypothetical protein
MATKTKRLAVGTKVAIATPQGSQFDGKRGVITKQLDLDAYTVRIDGYLDIDLMFSANEMKVTKSWLDRPAQLSQTSGRGERK